MPKRPVHPAADAFPRLPPDELRALAEDIGRNGLLHPIVVDPEGRVVDGRNRLAACEMAGVEPTFQTHRGDALSFICSANVLRRNLTKSQLAAVAVELAPEYEAAAKARQRRGKRDLGVDRPGGNGRALELASGAVGVSRVTAQRALAVKRSNPTLFERIRTGSVTVNAAWQEVGLGEVDRRISESPAARRDHAARVVTSRRTAAAKMASTMTAWHTSTSIADMADAVAGDAELAEDLVDTLEAHRKWVDEALTALRGAEVVALPQPKVRKVVPTTRKRSQKASGSGPR